MLRRIPRKAAVYDILHKTVVSGLIGITVLGSCGLVYRGYRFFTVTRPAKKEQNRMIQEEKITQQQIEREAELMMQQHEAENLQG